MIGTRVGHYEITEKLGEGGMGVVYRATDTKLGRDVAVKVLPETFAGDDQRMGRFEREARVLASLNHPHIASIYGLEESNGVRALLMELVEGPTLADRTADGPMPLDEALPTARQIAEALEYAHEHGVIHRDLKPANVKLTAEGAVKVLDFGLAKALEEEAASGTEPSISPTLTMRATQAGVILGTAAYMSPEQARGQPADKRADIWSFGVVLYEMLAGRQLFQDETVSDTLAAVLTRDPDWEQLPTGTPPGMRRLLRRCLEKNRRNRLQAIGEARIAIEEYQADPDGGSVLMEAPVVARQSARWRLLPWAVAALCFLVAVFLGAIHFGREVPARETLRFQVQPPPQGQLYRTDAISPDGRALAFVAATAEDVQRRVWIQRLDSLAAEPLESTDDAVYPFWSPDSRRIGYFAGNQLKMVAAGGGPSLTLYENARARGGSWNADGVILFSSAEDSGIYQVPAGGGAAKRVTTPSAEHQESGHQWPHFLPDGRHFLYLAVSSNEGSDAICVGSLDGSAPKRLVAARSKAEYSSGRLLYHRGGTLMAQPFDLEDLATTGDPFPVVDEVAFATYQEGETRFSTSMAGALTYQAGDRSSDHRAWLDRQGREISGVAGVGGHPDISPDGSRVVFERVDESGNQDIWIQDLVRGSSLRLTHHPATDWVAVWSPDGRRIVFTSNRDGAANGFQLYQRDAAGAGEAELLLASEGSKHHLTWSPDGKYIVYENGVGTARLDLWILPMEKDGEPFPFLETAFSESNPRFSPDGKWLAYTSNESGRLEVYVRRFPDAKAGLWPISTSGGTNPRWRDDGKELYYLGLNGKLMMAGVEAHDSGLTVDVPTPLFQTILRTVVAGTHFAATRDGERFLLPAISGEGESTPITVVLNWAAGAKH